MVLIIILCSPGTLEKKEKKCYKAEFSRTLHEYDLE